MVERAFFVTGGTLQHDAACYIERQADKDLHEELMRGEFCYVLTSRQTGKSSLMVRTAARLRQAGVAVTVLDLTSLGQILTNEQWYAGLLAFLGQDLDLEDELEMFWLAHPHLGPLQRFFAALEQVALPSLTRDASSAGTREVGGRESRGDGPDGSRIADHGLRLVIFIDEIDAVRSLPFSTDEFFAAIRACYNRRNDGPELRSLTFCLLGVATPSDLIQDTRVTPFNIGRRIELTDFTSTEAAKLAKGLTGSGVLGSRRYHRDEQDEQDDRTEGDRPVHPVHPGPVPCFNAVTPERLLQRVLYWTGGHPYLTQRLCRAVAEEAGRRAPGMGCREGAAQPPSPEPYTSYPHDVDRLCEKLFLSRGAWERDDNLLFVRDRLLRSEVDLASLLDLYGQVRAGRRVAADDTNRLVGVLRLSGVARVVEGRLRLRNRIYARVFDRDWVTHHMPDAELRRQRTAYRRGLIRASGVAGVIVAMMAGLSLTAVSYAHRAREATDHAEQQARRVQGMADQLRKALDGKEAALQALQVSLTATRQAQRRARQEAVKVDRARRRAVDARGLAEAARVEAVDAEKEAERQKRIALAEQEEKRRRLVRLNVATGTRFVDEGDLIGALPWFAESLRLDQGTPGAATHRRRFAAVLQQCPKPVQVLFHDGPVHDAAFSPDGRRVVSASADGTARVWVSGAAGESVGVRLKHMAEVWHAAFSPDGRRVVTASRDGTGRVWDAASGRAVTPPLRHRGPVRVAAFSLDGRQVLTASDDHTARVWDATTGAPLTAPLKHWAGSTPPPVSPWTTVVHAAFSPDGRRWLTTFRDREVWVWVRGAAGEPIGRPLLHPSEVRHAAFSPDGRQVVTLSDRAVQLWDVLTGQPSTLPIEHQHYVDEVRFSSDGRYLVTASRDKTARVWDGRSGRAITPPLQHRGPVRQAAFSPDGRAVVTVSREEARVWDARLGRPLSPFLKHSGMVRRAAFSPDGRRVVTASEDGTVRVWDRATGQAPTVSLPHRSWVEQVAFSPEGDRVVTASWDDTARVWNAATGQPVTPPLPHDDILWHVAFSPDGRRVVTASNDYTARVWEAATGRPVTPPLRHAEGVIRAVFSPEGRRVATASSDGTAQVWDAATGRRLARPLPHKGAVVQVAFSPSGRRIVTASRDNTARVWDAATGAPVTGPLRHSAPLWQAAFSPDGHRVVTASGDGTARVWDAATGRPLLPPLRHPDEVRQVAFSPEGRRIVTASGDHTARVWDATTGQPLTPPLAHDDEVRDACFSPDGRQVATASRDRTARVWDAVTGEAITPPLPHREGVMAARFSPDGRRLVTASGDNAALIWPLPSDLRPADLQGLAQWLAAFHLEERSRTVPLPAAGRRGAWRALRSRYPREFVPSSRQLLAWHDQEAVGCEAAERWSGALYHLDRLIEVQPDDTLLRGRRAHALAALGQWKAAADEVDRAIERGEQEVESWDRLALLRLAQGDTEGYRQTCADMLRRFGSSEYRRHAGAVAWTCVLAPAAGVDPAALVRLVEPESAGSLSNARALTTLGAALYRAGRLEEAVQWLTRADALVPPDGPATHALWLAMAHHRLGRPEPARQWWERAAQWIEKVLLLEPRDAPVPGFRPSWQVRQEVQVLRGEAAALLEVGRP